MSGRQLAYHVLLRIPVGTVCSKEVAFRAVLPAALHRVAAQTRRDRGGQRAVRRLAYPADRRRAARKPARRRADRLGRGGRRRAYTEAKWANLAPVSRRSVAEALVTIALSTKEPGAPDPKVLRQALFGWAFNPATRDITPPPHIAAALDWAERASLPVTDLEDTATVRLALGACAITLAGKPAAGPMCGIGTTLVEAVHLGRDGLGVEYEDRWAEVAAANVAHARRQDATGGAEVIRGDARLLPGLLPEGTAGRAALVVTSLPYGPSVHGQAVAEQRRGTEGGVRKYDNRYGHDPANLASQGLDELLAGFTQILSGCAVLLRPGGLAVVTARPWRQHGELVDLPAAVIAAGARAGLVPVARCAALLAGLRGGKLIARPSFFQLDNLRRARAKGQPWHLIVHEDVLIFRAPGIPGSSRELKGSHGELKPAPLQFSHADPRVAGESGAT